MLYFILPNFQIGAIDTIFGEKNDDILSKFNVDNSLKNLTKKIHTYKNLFSFFDNNKFITTIDVYENTFLLQNIKIENVLSSYFFNNSLFTINKDGYLRSHNIINKNIFWKTNIIDYVTIASTGDAADFGDLLTVKSNGVGLSRSTRGTFGGGYITDAVTNVNEYITIASTGNSTDFGNLTVAREDLAGVSNSTRGIIGGGAAPSVSNVLDFFTIASTGNSADFGDLTAVKRGSAGNSDSHGGLQG